MKKSLVVKTKVGSLVVVANPNGLESIDFFKSKNKPLKNEKLEPTVEKQIESHLMKAKKQLLEYFEGSRDQFQLPLSPSRGTPFQKKVWKALCGIPYGKTRSYSDIAIKIGSPKAVRAVGGANNRNPLAIVVPCHRVIGKSGSLIGYAGGLNMKSELLKLEGVL